MAQAAGTRRRPIGLLAALLAMIAVFVGVVAWMLRSDEAATISAPAAVRRDAPAAQPPPVAPEPPAGTGERNAAAQPDARDDGPPPYGDLFALLEWLEQPGRGPLPEVVADGPAFQALFASQSRERWIEAGPYLKRMGEKWADGAVLALEPGVFVLEHTEPPRGAMPPDVTLAGGGMSRTLVFFGGLRPTERLARFTLRDCTVFTDNQPLIDAPDQLVALTVERARLIGFDSGQISAPLVRARGLGVQMRDCELLGGYGRAPGSGSLFDVPSAALLARLERCRIAGVRPGFEAWNAGVTLALVDGAGADLIGDPNAALAGHAGIALTNTPLGLLAAGSRPRALELEALFKNWRKLAK